MRMGHRECTSPNAIRWLLRHLNKQRLFAKERQRGLWVAGSGSLFIEFHLNFIETSGFLFSFKELSSWSSPWEEKDRGLFGLNYCLNFKMTQVKPNCLPEFKFFAPWMIIHDKFETPTQIMIQWKLVVSLVKSLKWHIQNADTVTLDIPYFRQIRWI